MNYYEILIFKNISNFISENINDYDTYIFNDIKKPTIEQIKIWNIEFKKNNCKEESKKRIANSDWSVLTDVNISNKPEFENYRNQLRNLIINPVEDPVFPVEPNPIWNN